MDLRLRSNEASGPVARKPSGRRVFCPWAALARSLQPAAGMRGPRRLAHSQNPSPQRPSEFFRQALRIAMTFPKLSSVMKSSVLTPRAEANTSCGTERSPGLEVRSTLDE